jgi:hypothetical protein
VLGDGYTQLALSLSALLPWLCLHFRHSPQSPLAAVCIAVSCPFDAMFSVFSLLEGRQAVEATGKK